MPPKRKSYSAHYKLQVVKYAAENGNRASERKFGVSEKLVRDWRKAEATLAAMKKTKKANRGLKARWPELEERVHRWVLEQRAAGRGLSTVQLRLHALVVAKEMNINGFACGPSWCYRFMQRNRLSIRARTTVCQELPADFQSEVGSFREFVEEQDEEDRKHKEEQFMAELARTKQDLEQQQENLKRQKCQTVCFPFDTKGPISTIISQAACSPSSSSDIPVISHVYSLSTGPLRGKRTKPATPQQTPKRPKVNGFNLGISDSSTPVDVSPRSSPSVPVIDDDDDDTDGEIIIFKTASTPEPQKSGFDCTKVKTEQEQSDVSMPMERSEDAALDATGPAHVGTSPCPAPPTTVATTSQTQVPRVKKEEEDQSQTEGEERAGQSGKEQSSGVDINVCSEQRVIKQESSGDTGENQGKQTLQEGVTCRLDGEDDAGPSCADDKRGSPLHHPSMTDIQEQQDQLLELMQATAQERDCFKEQVRELSCQLQDMQSRLQELSQINVKKECSHQASQTEETQGEKDYKSLFEKAKQKVDELIKDKEALLAATETRPSAAQGEDTDEIALQVDGLLRELDQRNKERDELRSQLASVEEERANLASQCEELRMSLQQQREEGSTTPHRAADSSVQSDRAAAGGTAASDTHSSSDASGRLDC